MKPAWQKSADFGEKGAGRRRLLRTMILGGALAVVGGAVARLRTSHYPIDAATAARLTVLRPWQYVVVRDVARRMLAPDEAGSVPSPDDVGVAEFADGYLAKLEPALRHDFLRMLVVVEQLAPLSAGFWHRFTELSPEEQDRVLSSLESSVSHQLRAGFQALKGLVMMGYYRSPATFSLIGYRGPLIDTDTTPAAPTDAPAGDAP
jgi:hypothetical protein